MFKNRQLKCVVCSDQLKSTKVFPFPKVESANFACWRQAAGKSKGWLPSLNDGICQRHFADTQFYKASNPLVVAKPILVATAVPNINLGICFICYKEISWKRFLLTNKSEHSDRTLFQVLGEFQMITLFSPSELNLIITHLF